MKTLRYHAVQHRHHVNAERLHKTGYSDRGHDVRGPIITKLVLAEVKHHINMEEEHPVCLAHQHGRAMESKAFTNAASRHHYRRPTIRHFVD